MGNLPRRGDPSWIRTNRYVAVAKRAGAPDAWHEFDHDTQFCLCWFEGNGWKEGKFGEADTLARAKVTSVDGVKQSGVVYATGGVVRLLKWAEYPTDGDPQSDSRLPVWEVLHQL